MINKQKLILTTLTLGLLLSGCGKSAESTTNTTSTSRGGQIALYVPVYLDEFELDKDYTPYISPIDPTIPTTSTHILTDHTVVLPGTEVVYHLEGIKYHETEKVDLTADNTYGTYYSWEIRYLATPTSSPLVVANNDPSTNYDPGYIIHYTPQNPGFYSIHVQNPFGTDASTAEAVATFEMAVPTHYAINYNNQYIINNFTSVNGSPNQTVNLVILGSAYDGRLVTMNAVNSQHTNFTWHITERTPSDDVRTITDPPVEGYEYTLTLGQLGSQYTVDIGVPPTATNPTGMLHLLSIIVR